MFRKLVIIGIILGLAGSASAIKYVGDPNATNGWDTTSAVTEKDPKGMSYADVAAPWVPYDDGQCLVDGNGINPSNKDQHSTAEYPGAYTGCPPTPCTTYPAWECCVALQYTGTKPILSYDTDMDQEIGGLCWFAFEFTSVNYVADMEVWNYNAYPGGCLPEGTQSPCQWTTKPGYSIKDWKISYSRDGILWKEWLGGTAAKGTALTQGPEEGWNWSDDAQYPDTIAIDANAKYVVLHAINTYQGGIRAGIGEARFETDPNRATKPHKNGGNKFRNMPLSWRPGNGAVYHDVYLSTSESAVTNRTAPNSLQTPPYSPTLVAGPVGAGTQYYWAVDELDGSYNVTGEGTGRVWSFTEIDLGLVDDFRSYDKSSKYIYDTWVDGWVPSPLTYPNGGYVTLNSDYDKFTNQQGMQIDYDNDGTWNNTAASRPIAVYYSEVRAETDDLIASCGDLTVGGEIASIRTWVMGETTNDANEQVYIKLEDGDGNTAQVQYLPATDMDDGEWHEWRIALSDFTTANPNIDLTDVNAISVVIGDAIGPGGTGTIYFDQIRLQPPECGIMGETDPTLAQGDLNDDCVIDWKDLAILVDNWLDAGTSP